MTEVNQLQLEYNTGRDSLTISEHGRHVQKLIAYAKNIQKDDYRQAFVESIIDLMEQMNPQNKNVKEYRERLWKHLFRIADYDINVTPPEGLVIEDVEKLVKKEKLEYPQTEFRFRHYGHYIQNLIKKAIEMEDEEKKAEFVKVIAFYMKLAYRTWNQDNYVNDETIKSDLKMMSKGMLTLDDDHVINTKAYNTSNNRSKNNSRGRNNNNRGRSNSNNNRGRSNNNKNRSNNYKRK